MKKTLTTLSIISALISLSIFADSSQIKQENTVGDTILITSNPYNQSTDEIMSTVSVITRIDIERVQPKSVAELLRTTVGIDIASNGGPAQVTSVFVRGTNSTHTLFLVDGVRINTVTGSGGTSVNDIPTYQIERIEVVKGPRAAMYGSDAVGAVIQIFTRDLEAGEYQAAVEYGSNNYMFAGVTTGISHGKGSTTLSISSETSDGYNITANEYLPDDDKDSYEKINLSIKGHQEINDALTLNWVGRYDEGKYDYDGNSSYTVLAPSQEYTKHLLSTGLSYNQDKWSHDLSIAQYQENQKRLGDYPGKNEINRNQVDYSSVYSVQNGLSYNFGGQFYQSKYKGTGSFDGKSRYTASAFAGALYDTGALLTELYLRYNDVEDTGSETAYNVSLGYHLSDSLFASVNYGTGFKAPTFYQLFDSGLYGAGNPDLALETSASWELLLRSTIFDIKAELSYFHLDFDNLIAYINNHYENIADAKIKGVELNLSKNLNDLNLSANYAYTDTEDKTTGTQLSRRARHKANFEASYDWEKISLSGAYRYQGTRFDAYSKSSLSPYSIIDISVNYQLTEAWKLQVKANNIFDKEYETAPSYITPGAEYFLQVSYNHF